VDWPLPVISELAHRPEGFIAPDLSPQGLELLPRELADGVWALMANKLPKDNNGLVVGTRAALVIDSGITPGMGRYIRDLAARLTDKRVLYLANTTFHGDHTFGNVAFGGQVTVVSSRLNRDAMNDLEEEKRFRGESMYGTPGLEEITTWRKPDVVFDTFHEIDLGGRTVQLWHFGPGNGPGDTVVYVPDAKVAWVGNFLRYPGIPPMMLAGDPVGYARTVCLMRHTLQVATIVPGHGPLTPAAPALDYMRRYIEHLAADVQRHRARGTTLSQMYQDLPPAQGLLDLAAVQHCTPQEAHRFAQLMRSNHQLNIMAVHRWLDLMDQWSQPTPALPSADAIQGAAP
jgi:cyclase